MREAQTHPAGSDGTLSLWIDDSPKTSYPPLSADVQADIAIVGGGITGITAAYLLAKAGQKVVLIEKGRVAMSETGHTTAHIVESTDADYGDLISDHGEEGARLNTEAIRESMSFIQETVSDLQIDCDLRTVEGYLYTERQEHVEYLQRQREHLERAGVRAEWVEKVPLPFQTVGALRFTNQMAFHIRRYLLPLLEAAVENGAQVFEQTQATGVESGDESCSLKTDRGSVQARHVLLTTHVPINDRGVLWAKMHVTRTYVIAARIAAGRVPDALFWDTEYPYHYTRLQQTDEGLFLIVGGEDEDVGKDENDTSRFTALQAYVRERFGLNSVAYRWSGQINEPADMLPFIGESSHGKRIWMSTGYSGTGMTYGTLAAMILADLALGRENRFADLYSPSRTKAMSVLENVVTKATAFPKRMLAKLTRSDVEAHSVAEVGEGEGKIVSAGGEKYAIARIDGELCSVSASCTHMGCTVNWNEAEQSWDCPCHGSRFDVRGQVLNGPATSPLQAVTPETMKP